MGPERRYVDDLTIELISALEWRDVWRLRMKSDADHHKIKVFDRFSGAIMVSNPPSRAWCGLFGHPENCTTQADVRQHSEVTCIAGEVIEKGRTRRELGGIFWQWPIGELIEFALNLDAEIEISVSPHAARCQTTFEERAVEP